MRAPLAPASRLLPLFLASFLGSGCQKHEAAAANEPAIRLGLLPHVDAATELREQANFAVYLEGATGAHVDMNIGKSYATMVDAICGGEDDVVQLGGLTYLQAADRCGVVPIVQRDIDQSFHSLFITPADSPIHSLKDLAGHSFAFGSPDSTSGHLMPAYFMGKEGVDPAIAAKAIYSGGHDKTAAQVAAKKVDAGALSESVFNKLVAEGKLDPKAVRVFYTTPAYVDDVWVARKDLDPKVKEKFAKALIALSAADPEQKAILEKFGAKSFVAANDSSYGALRTAAVEQGLLKK